MAAHIFKYFSARLALSYLLFILVIMGVVSFGDERGYPGYFLYTLFFLCFILSCAALSHLGKWRFNALMIDAQDCDITRFFRKGEILFEKLLILTNSFHFLPQTAKHLKERVYIEYSRFLLARDVTGWKALRIHKKALEYGGENQELEARLISCLLNKKKLERDEIALGARLVPRDQTGEFLDLLVRNCLKRPSLGYESQEVFRLALEKDSPYVPAILNQVLPDFLRQERRDPFALMLYFVAVRKKHRLAEKGRKMLHRLATPYLFDKDLEGTEKKLVDFFNAGKGTAKAPSKDAILEKAAGRLSPGMIEAEGRRKEKTEEGPGKGLERAQYRDWRQMLPDATSFYVICGAMLILFLGFRLYRERLTSLKKLPKPLTPAASKREAPVEGSIKYVPFHSDKPFTIQVGAYNSIAKAERIMEAIRKETGLIVYWLPARIGDKEWYRVRVGEFQDQKTARFVAGDLSKKSLVGKDYYLTNFKGGFILREEAKDPPGS